MTEKRCPGRYGRKGQAQMLEYLLMMVFVVAVILVLMLFLTFWQVSQLSVEESRNNQDRALMLAKSLINSPFLVKDESVFDSAKLMALSGRAPMVTEACELLRDSYGDLWTVEITSLDGEPVRDCTQTDYPDCNRWVLCPGGGGDARISRILPVNVYDPFGFELETGSVLPRVYVGKLNVTIYV